MWHNELERYEAEREKKLETAAENQWQALVKPAELTDAQARLREKVTDSFETRLQTDIEDRKARAEAAASMKQPVGLTRPGDKDLQEFKKSKAQRAYAAKVARKGGSFLDRLERDIGQRSDQKSKVATLLREPPPTNGRRDPVANYVDPPRPVTAGGGGGRGRRAAPLKAVDKSLFAGLLAG